MRISAENIFQDFNDRHLVRFGRPGRAAKGEPRHVCRHYVYPTLGDASRAFWRSTIGDGQPVDDWKAPTIELSTRGAP